MENIKIRNNNKALFTQFLRSGMSAAKLVETYPSEREAKSRRDSINSCIIEQQLQRAMGVSLRNGVVYLYRKRV